MKPASSEHRQAAAPAPQPAAVAAPSARRLQEPTEHGLLAAATRDARFRMYANRVAERHATARQAGLHPLHESYGDQTMAGDRQLLLDYTIACEDAMEAALAIRDLLLGEFSLAGGDLEACEAAGFAAERRFRAAIDEAIRHWQFSLT